MHTEGDFLYLSETVVNIVLNRLIKIMEYANFGKIKYKLSVLNHIRNHCGVGYKYRNKKH